MNALVHLFMSKKVLIHASVLAISFAPLLVSAQATGDGIQNFIDGTLTNIVGALINFMIAIATLVFIFGVVQYIAAGGDEAKTKTARSYIVFSIIGLAAILGIWGISRFLVEGLVGTNTGVPTIEL